MKGVREGGDEVIYQVVQGSFVQIVLGKEKKTIVEGY